MNKRGLRFLGLVAGFFSAALGIGGGTVMVPTLVLLFGYKIKKVIGTSLATIVPTVTVGVLAHYVMNSNNIKLTTALFVIVGSVIGSQLGARIATRLHGNVLRKLFAVLLFFAGLKLAGIITLPTEAVSIITFKPLLILLGLVVGSASAFFGIGGGVIMVPMLNLFFGLSIHEAIATSLIVILPTTMAGALFHNQFDNIDRKAIRFLIPTALIGAVLGAVFANNMPAIILKIMLGILVLLSSIKLFLQKEKPTPQELSR